MAFEKDRYSVTRQAGADLSTHKYKFVKLNSSGQAVLCAATTDVPYGILQNAPGSLQPALVMRAGVSRLIFGGSIATGTNMVGTDGAGKGTVHAVGVGGTAAYPVCFVEEGVNVADLIGTVDIDATGAPKRAF
jgi:hypothetical protein